MDQRNPNPSDRGHVPTEAEIARLEAEAVAALQRGESVPRPEGLPREAAPATDARPPRPDFVPYVDDVPEPEPPKARPTARPAEPADAPDEEDDEEYIPGPWEKRIDALSPEQWRRWQIIGGAVLGLLAVTCLFVFGQELATYGLILAVLLAILLPRYLERAWRHPMPVARRAMIVAMVAGLAVITLVIGLRTGFRFTDPA